MLTLDRTDPTNGDTYTCTIENDAGTNSTMITLDGKKVNVTQLAMYILTYYPCTYEPAASCVGLKLFINIESLFCY